jgi:hypothetical protein
MANGSVVMLSLWLSLVVSVTYKPFLLHVVMLNVSMLNVVMLNVVMLNVVMLNVFMVSVMTPN